MRRFLLFLSGALLGGGVVVFAYQYHVVRASEGPLLVPKKQASLDDLYADVRAWDMREWREHPRLVQSLIAHGRSDLVVQPTSREFLDQLLRNISSASADSNLSVEK